MTIDYEALSVEAHAAIHSGGHVAGGLVLRDAFDAELAEVRAEMDDAKAGLFIEQQWHIAHSGKVADRDRTIAERDAVIERRGRAIDSISSWLLHRFGPNTPEGQEAMTARQALGERP